MPPTSSLDLDLDKDDFDLDKPSSVSVTSPAINIQTADRFPASPWNEYNTDWKFPDSTAAAADEPSNQYTPSYGSFNSYGSHSPSWHNREMTWDNDDYIMENHSSSRHGSDIANMHSHSHHQHQQQHHHHGGVEDYNPTSFDNDMVVGDLDVPSVSLTPAMDAFPSSAQQQHPHSPGYSGAASPSSPGSDAGRSRASSGSSVHPPYPFDNNLMNTATATSQQQKPPSPPAIVIPDDGQQGLGLNPAHTQNAAAGLGVSIHIVPSTPVGGVDARNNAGHNTNDSYPDNQSNSSNPNDPQGWPSPHASPQQFPGGGGAGGGGHSRSGSGSGSISAHASPRLAPGIINIDYAPAVRPTYAQHRSPALSASSSLHNSPMPHYQNLAPSPAESPRHLPSSSAVVEDYPLLPDSNPIPGGGHRPRASSAGNHPHPHPHVHSSPSALGLGALTISPGDMHQYGSSAGTPAHYEGGLHPSTATLGASSFLSASAGGGGAGQGGSGGADLRRSLSDRGNAHRRGVKSEDLRGTSFVGSLGIGPIDPALTSGGNNNNNNNNVNNVNNDSNNDNNNNDMGMFAPPQSDYLYPPTRSPRPVHARHSSLGTSPSPSGSPSYQHSSHNYKHHSARSSPYPSPHASPARGALHLPDLGPAPGGPPGGGMGGGMGGGGSSLGLFDTYGATGAAPDQHQHQQHQHQHQHQHQQHHLIGIPGMGSMGGMHPMQVVGGPMGGMGGGGGGGMGGGIGGGGQMMVAAGGVGVGGGPFSTTNPPKRLVTTKATHDASVSRRKNEAGYRCPVEGCGSTFTRSFNLKGHLRSHMEERPFKCKWPGCGKGFARQHDCKRHEALHLNVRPYTCAGCKKNFARMDALNRHLKSEGGAECAGVQQEYDLSGNNGNGNGAGGGPSANGNNGNGGGGGNRKHQGQNGPPGDMDGGVIM